MLETSVIVGGGAAGFFAAIKCAETFPKRHVIILEKTAALLAKVRISGGGRCNVTHACFDPKELIKFYPRGSLELLGPFHRFQPRDTMEWFQERGVKLKIEQDGRVFPVSDSSESIINCLLHEARRLKIEIKTLSNLEDLEQKEGLFLLKCKNEKIVCNQLLLATGGSTKAYHFAESLGHKVIAPVPSLFTFNIPNLPLIDLSGISVPKVKIQLKEFNLEAEGALLITHWGLSGPAVLRLSAWGARDLAQCHYVTKGEVNWLPDISEQQLRDKLMEERKSSRMVSSEPLFALPKQLWKRFIELACINLGTAYAQLKKEQLEKLILLLRHFSFEIQGRTAYKSEFVTCGGVALNEVNFKTMESKRCPGLFFAGEVLDIDGITGGFNFQNAWTTGWIAGESMK